ncbi:winged helix DNA-binding domain-containing protein [Rhizohabitans arisaemae]|uniref:winged helix DNA-binding domain-containing protein n=1 Tax=Rhizohabitans arisaemae TaxID=2720610 RepID=UPI0024B1E4FB|nr:winged helix DNA-binding domain-containing protein [Rhizohabitans arisaemae]
MLSDADVRRARTASQSLHRPAGSPAVDTLVGELLAVQAQDALAGALALRARARGLTLAGVEAARADTSIVRAWGPRGTLHFAASADLPWLIALTGPPRIPNALRRLAEEKVEGPHEAVEEALAGQGPLTKEELGERLAKVGVRAHGQGVVHLAGLAAARGVVLLGPDRGGKPTYVHAADWLGRELVLERDRDRALAELARRYLSAHAPAEPADLVAWSGLPLRDARAGWNLIAGELAEVVCGGGRLWRLRRRPLEPVAGVVRLTPAFDEYLLGWRDRGPVLAEEHAKAVHPGGGVLRATVVDDGRVTGTWRMRRVKGDTEVTVELFSGGADDRTGFGEEIADVKSFLGHLP